jgi:hypothetical protein
VLLAALASALLAPAAAVALGAFATSLVIGSASGNVGKLMDAAM